MPTLVKEIFDTLPSYLTYHCLEHTMQVAGFAMQLSEAAKLNEKEERMLYAAAVLHDAGYGKKYHANEGVAAILATKILPDFGFKKKEVKQVRNMILSTNLIIVPSDDLEMLLVDADLAYLGKPDFFMWSNRLFQEWKNVEIFDKPSEEWLKLQIDFLEKHYFHTPEANALFEEGKQENLNRLKSMDSWPF